METAILWWIIFAIIGGAIGAMKGRIGPGILLGVFLGPLGVLIACCLFNQKDIDKKPTKKCPHCAERVKKEAKVCRFCHKSVASVLCPHCKTRLFKPESGSGTECKCPKCSKAIIIS